MLFITAQQLPSFIIWDKSRSPGYYSWLWLPRLKPRQVPISQYLLQVITFASGTLLNNLVFAFSVPLTLQIVFRSAGKYIYRESALLSAGSLWTGLAVSMLLGRFFMDKRYTLKQTVLHLLISLSRTSGTPPHMLTVILPSPFLSLYIFFRATFREDCGSNCLVRRHHRDPLSAPPRVADHGHPRPRDNNKPHKHNRRSQHRRRIAVHYRHRDARSVARMHRHTRRTTRAHL